MIKTVLTNQSNPPFVSSSSSSGEGSVGESDPSSYRSLNDTSDDRQPDQSTGTLLDLIDKLKRELTAVKQAKTQLATLYKVKCKSDLDKSAKITKLRLQFECELSSFCQHDQKDLVRYLQRQLLARDQRLSEQAYDLEQLRNAGMTESIKKKTEPVQILRRNDPDLVTSTHSLLP